MGSVFFIALRRLRAPLILLIVIVAISTAGLSLIPGVDAEGRPVRLTIFQAFYFVSYTATTIGFGEVPYAFTDRQRLWVTFIIYSSVVGWTYLIGGVLRLGQDKGFQQAIVSARFARNVRHMREPFFIVCGLGETGMTIVRSLDVLGFRSVVLDVDERRIQELELEDLSIDAPALAADASLPDILLMAGLRKRECQGVLVLSASDEANLAVAIAVHLLNPELRTICRNHTPAISVSLATIGVYQILNPFREFSERLVLAMRSPDTYRLISWLTGLPGARLPRPIPAPPGHWIVCGYGRFGMEIAGSIQRAGFKVSIIDPRHGAEWDVQVVNSHGADAAVLREAGIESAAGIVAGTDNDSINLAIGIAARAMRPEIFIILRQNLLSNRLLFEAARAEMTMVSSEIIANQCLALLHTRVMGEFLAIARARDDDWAEDVIQRLRETVGDEAPNFWSVTLTKTESPGMIDAMADLPDGLRLADLSRDISDRDRTATIVPLLIVRGDEKIELPTGDMRIFKGDTILLAGSREAERDLRHILCNANVARYVLQGEDALRGLVWRALANAFSRKRKSGAG